MYSQNNRPSSLFIKLSEFIELNTVGSSIFKEEAYMTTTLLNCFYAKDTRRRELLVPWSSYSIVKPKCEILHWVGDF